MLTKDASNDHDRAARHARGRFRLASASVIVLSMFFSLTLGGVLPAQARYMPADGSHAPFENKYQANAGETGPAYAEGTDNEDAFQHYEARVLESVNEYWKKQFSAWERPLNEARYFMVPSGMALRSSCDGAVAQDPAENPTANPTFYCRDDQPPTIYISTPWMMREIYRAFHNSEKAVAVLLAHEYGHHIQHDLGVENAESGGMRSRKSFELQADCLAGNWAGYYPGYVTQNDEPDITAAWAKLGSESEQESGAGYPSGQERVDWFWKGFNDGVPVNCDPPQ